MDVMDHNSQGDRNEEQQHHQNDADIMSCEEQQEPMTNVDIQNHLQKD